MPSLIGEVRAVDALAASRGVRTVNLDINSPCLFAVRALQVVRWRPCTQVQGPGDSCHEGGVILIGCMQRVCMETHTHQARGPHHNYHNHHNRQQSNLEKLRFIMRGAATSPWRVEARSRPSRRPNPSPAVSSGHHNSMELRPRRKHL